MRSLPCRLSVRPRHTVAVQKRARDSRNDRPVRAKTARRYTVSVIVSTSGQVPLPLVTTDRRRLSRPRRLADTVSTATRSTTYSARRPVDNHRPAALSSQDARTSVDSVKTHTRMPNSYSSLSDFYGIYYNIIVQYIMYSRQRLQHSTFVWFDRNNNLEIGVNIL